MNARLKRTKSVCMVVWIWVGVAMVGGVSPALADPTPISSVPYTINQSGSYCLSRNLTMTADSNGITVNADHVTIDLMGFTLKGRGTGEKDGITMKGRSNVEIRNGTVENWGGVGVVERGDDATGHRLVNVRAVSNGMGGVLLGGDSHLVKDCTSVFGGAGIFVGAGSVVTGNTTSWNLVWGIITGDACTVTRNESTMNLLGDGITVASGCTVSGNTVYACGRGIVVDGNGSLVKCNTIRETPSNGIDINGTDNAIEENLVTKSMTGIRFRQSGNLYANNRAADCTTCFSGSAVDGGGNRCF